MKNAKVVTVTNEETEDLHTFLIESLPLSYDQFLLKYFKHPKFKKELFFLLKTDEDKIVSMFANRDISIFDCDLNVALFGNVATHPGYRKKGCMKFLVRNLLKKLQEEEDLIINPWSAKRNYKRVYAKLGFSRVKKLKTTFEFYKTISKENGFSKIINFHEFRMRGREVKEKKQIFFTLILYFQYLCLSGIHILQRAPKICNVEKLEELKKNDVKNLNMLFVEYCSKRARNFFERDEETWQFIYDYNDIYLIKHGGEAIGYAVGSILEHQLIISEIYAKDSGTYFYAISHFEELARKKEKKEITIWADTLHRSLTKYGYIPNDITFIMPFDPRSVTIIARTLKNFFEKMDVNCKLNLYDPLLDSRVEIGTGDFSINLMQKDMADLVFGGSAMRTLFKAEVRPKYKILDAYKVLSNIKKRYGMVDCLRTRFDMY